MSSASLLLAASATTSTPRAASPRSPRSSSRVSLQPPYLRPLNANPDLTWPQVTRIGRPQRSRTHCHTAASAPSRGARKSERRPAPSWTKLYVPTRSPVLLLLFILPFFSSSPSPPCLPLPMSLPFPTVNLTYAPHLGRERGARVLESQEQRRGVCEGGQGRDHEED